MYHEHLLRLFFKGLYPVDQPLLIRMTAQSRHFPDLSAHGNRLTEQLHFVSTLYQCPAQCSHRLIADEQDRTLRSPQIMLQMMPDTSCITHTGCGDNDLRCLVEVDGFGFLTGDRQLQSRKSNGINTLFYEFHSLIIEAFPPVLLEYAGSLYRHWTVHIHREIFMPLYQAPYLDLPQEIQNLLGTAHRKRRDHHVTAPV